MKAESGVTWHSVSNQRHVVRVPGERDIQAPRVSQEPDALLHVRPHAGHNDEVFLAALEVGQGGMGLVW